MLFSMLFRALLLHMLTDFHVMGLCSVAYVCALCSRCLRPNDFSFGKTQPAAVSEFHNATETLKSVDICLFLFAWVVCVV